MKAEARTHATQIRIEKERERDGNCPAEKETKKRFLAHNVQAHYIHSNFFFYYYVYTFFSFFRFYLPAAVVFRCTLWACYKINALIEYLISATYSFAVGRRRFERHLWSPSVTINVTTARHGFVI